MLVWMVQSSMDFSGEICVSRLHAPVEMTSEACQRKSTLAALELFGKPKRSFGVLRQAPRALR